MILTWLNFLRKIRLIKIKNNYAKNNTLKNNLHWICNYFISWYSNWFAEWLHSRIRRDLSNARWYKNKDYMVYKIERKFS